MQKRIKEIYTPDVFGVSPGTRVKDALCLMRKKKASCVVVLEEQRPVGIFTERDVVRCVASHGPAFLSLPMDAVMTCQVRTVTRNTLLYEAFALLAESRIRHLVVVDAADGKAVGVVTLSNLINHFGYDYFVKVKTISQVMTPCLVVASPEDSLFTAATELAEKNVSFLVVCEEQRPVGVLTERDMTGLAAAGGDLQQARVKEHMSSPVLTLHEDQAAFDAVALMRAHGVRRLVVVDAAGKALGIVTQSDMVRGLESNYVETLRLIIKEQGEELSKIVRQLARKKLYLENILSSSVNLGIVALDEELKVNYFNGGAEKLLGIGSRYILGKDIRTIHDFDHVPFARVEQGIALVKDNKQVSFRFERKTEQGSRYVQAKVSGIHEGRKLAGFVLLLEDITEKHKAEETIRRLAYYDMLTGLPNRVLFYERLASEIARCRRNKGSFGLMLMDVDKFKDVNDTHGHHVGDLLLQQIAARLHGLLREVDTISRLGGDEFCFILTDVRDAAGAGVIADKILKQLNAPYSVDSFVLDMRFSFGIALYPEHGKDSGTLVRLADKAMYRAKDKGRQNRCSNIAVY